MRIWSSKYRSFYNQTNFLYLITSNWVICRHHNSIYLIQKKVVQLLIVGLLKKVIMNRCLLFTNDVHDRYHR